jgi:hypothetical protein
MENHDKYLKASEILTSSLRTISLALETILSKIESSSTFSRDLKAITSMIDLAINISDDLARELSSKNKIDEENAILH